MLKGLKYEFTLEMKWQDHGLKNINSIKSINLQICIHTTNIYAIQCTIISHFSKQLLVLNVILHYASSEAFFILGQTLLDIIFARI